MVLSFHRVKEVTSDKIENCLFVNGKVDPADVLTKHWAYHDIWPKLKPILFWLGDTMECFTNNSLSFKDGK